MAQVSMDMAELDSLRDKIKEQNKDIQEKTVLLAEIKADKRVMKITKNGLMHRAPFSIGYGLINALSRTQGYSKDFHYERGVVEDFIRNNITFHEMTEFGNSNDKIEFINFDDVREAIRAEFEDKYNTELVALRTAKTYADQKEKQLSNDFDEERTEYENGNRAYIQKLQNDHKKVVEYHQEIIETQNKEIQELKTGKKELTRIEELTEMVNTLTEQLKKEQEKGWLSKLFS